MMVIATIMPETLAHTVREHAPTQCKRANLNPNYKAVYMITQTNDTPKEPRPTRPAANRGLSDPTDSRVPFASTKSKPAI